MTELVERRWLRATDQQLRLRQDGPAAEGETPFLFDARSLGGRSDLSARLTLTPAPWLRLSSSGSYLLTDTRRPDDLGFQPLDSRVDLFGIQRRRGSDELLQIEVQLAFNQRAQYAE